MLVENSYGVSWTTWPRPNVPAQEQYHAQLAICQTVTSTIDTLANQTLRATLGTETEFGPDFTVTVRPNGWARMKLSRWPILQLVAAQVSPAIGTPTWVPVPSGQLQTEHSPLPMYGTITPSGAGPGPVAVLIPPGYVSWSNGRNGYLVQVSYVNGYPVAGMDHDAAQGATSIHVDDITGWWNGTAGARGSLYDGLATESVAVTGATPDTGTTQAGPGTLTLATPLAYAHTLPTQVAGSTIVLSALPSAITMAGYYLATHYGLIRGTTAAVMQSSRGTVVSTPGASTVWYDKAKEIIASYARVF